MTSIIIKKLTVTEEKIIPIKFLVVELKFLWGLISSKLLTSLKFGEELRTDDSRFESQQSLQLNQ